MDEMRIVRALRLGEFKLTIHARRRMDERSITAADIRQCARSANSIREQTYLTFKVVGSDLDGDRLTVICVWDGETVIVTLF